MTGVQTCALRSISKQDTNLLLQNIVEKVNSEQKEDSIVVGNNENYFVQVREVEDTEWVLVASVSYKEVEAPLKKLQVKYIMIAVILLIITIVLIERVLHFIIKPIYGLTTNIKDITDGDFTVQVDDKGQDEIAMMSSALKIFIQKMRTTLLGIEDIAGQLKEQANESNEASGTLHESAGSQAEAMNQLSLTVDEIAHAISELAKHATTLAIVVNETNENSLEANQHMEASVQISSDGQKDMLEVKKAMDRIIESMDELEGII